MDLWPVQKPLRKMMHVVCYHKEKGIIWVNFLLLSYLTSLSVGLRTLQYDSVSFT